MQFPIMEGKVVDFSISSCVTLLADLTVSMEQFDAFREWLGL